MRTAVPARCKGKNRPLPVGPYNPPDTSSKFHNPSINVILLNGAVDQYATEWHAQFYFGGDIIYGMIR
jgi:hypothetical protein